MDGVRARLKVFTYMFRESIHSDSISFFASERLAPNSSASWTHLHYAQEAPGSRFNKQLVTV